MKRFYGILLTLCIFSSDVLAGQLPKVEYDVNYLPVSHGSCGSGVGGVLTAPIRLLQNGHNRRIERRSNRGGIFRGVCRNGACG